MLKYLWIPTYTNANSHKLHVLLVSCVCEWMLVKNLKLLSFIICCESSYIAKEEEMSSVLSGCSLWHEFLGKRIVWGILETYFWQLCCFLEMKRRNMIDPSSLVSFTSKIYEELYCETILDMFKSWVGFLMAISIFVCIWINK